jgi:hypothetical protein
MSEATVWEFEAVWTPTRTGIGVAAIVSCATFAAGCALNRPDVKSLRDRETNRIRFDTTIETTIAALNAIPAHCRPSSDHQVRHEEFHVYQVIGRIGRVKHEPDHDIHIVLEDPDNPRAHLIVESDDPDFRRNVQSPYRDRLVVARHMFEELVRQSSAGQLKNLRGLVVRVVADRLHGKPVQAVDIADERPTVPVFLLPEGARVATK